MECLSKISSYTCWTFKNFEISKEQFNYVRGGTYLPKNRTFSQYNTKTKEDKFFFVGNKKDFEDFQNLIRFLD